jgi:hypothetical protein
VIIFHPHAFFDEVSVQIFCLFLIVFIVSPYYFKHFVCVVLGFELRASHLQGRCYTIWVMTAAHFDFGCFWERVSHLCLGWPGQWSSYLCFQHSWDDRQVPPHPAFVGWGGGLTDFSFFAQTAVSPISDSQVARIIGVSHQTVSIVDKTLQFQNVFILNIFSPVICLLSFF